MNSKAIKRQLLAAIAMVLVAAIALGSSTYAWFASNNKVTADGLKINAQAEGNLLLIGEKNLDAKKTSVSVVLSGTEGKSLFPTHPVAAAGTGATAEGTTIAQWNHRYSLAYDEAISSTATDEVDGTTVDSRKLANYVLKKELVIGLDTTNSSAACGAVTVSKVTIEGASADFLPCARVAITDKDGKLVGVYAPGNKYVSTFNEQTAADELTDMPTAGHGEIISALSASGTSSTTITVFVYFDGRDAACNSKNFNANEVTVALEFTSADATV